MIQTQFPCKFSALGTVHDPHTGCTTTDITKNQRQQHPFRECLLPCLRAPCPYLCMPFSRTGPTLACSCLAYAAYVLFAHVCHVITSGYPRTKPLRVSTLLIVHGLINIPCNANDVHRARLPHTCMRQAHSSLITHALAMYVMPAVFGGSCHCMCGNTLTIPHAPSLSVFCPTLTVCLLPDSRTRGGVLLSTRVMCVSACMRVCACVSCVCLHASCV